MGSRALPNDARWGETSGAHRHGWPADALYPVEGSPGPANRDYPNGCLLWSDCGARRHFVIVLTCDMTGLPALGAESALFKMIKAIHRRVEATSRNESGRIICRIIWQYGNRA